MLLDFLGGTVGLGGAGSVPGAELGGQGSGFLFVGLVVIIEGTWGLTPHCHLCGGRCQSLGHSSTATFVTVAWGSWTLPTLGVPATAALGGQNRGAGVMGRG